MWKPCNSSFADFHVFPPVAWLRSQRRNSKPFDSWNQMQRHHAQKQRCFSLLPTKLTFWKFELCFLTAMNSTHNIYRPSNLPLRFGANSTASWDPEKMKRHNLKLLEWVCDIETDNRLQKQMAWLGQLWSGSRIMEPLKETSWFRLSVARPPACEFNLWTPVMSGRKTFFRSPTHLRGCWFIVVAIFSR